MNKEEFWEETANNYQEQLNPLFEEYVKQRYFSFINILFTYSKNNEIVLKTDGWDLIYTPQRNPYDLLKSECDSIIITDISKPILDKINMKYKDIKTDNIKVQNLGSKYKNQIDLLIDLSTIDHVPEKEVNITINSYYNTLKKDGYALIVFWKKSWHFELLNFVYYIYKRKDKRLFFNEEKAAKDGQYYFDESNILSQLKKMGFKIVYKKRFGVVMPFLNRIGKLNKLVYFVDDILSYFSGGMSAIIVKKI